MCAKQSRRQIKPHKRPYRRSNRNSNTANGGLIRSIKQGAQFAWKHRKQIGGAAASAYKFYKGWKGSSKSSTSPMLRSALQGTSQHNDTSTRYFRCIVRKGRNGVIQKLMRKKHHFKYTEDWNAVLSSVEGRQGVGTLKCIGTKNQVTGTPLSTNRSDRVTSARSYYEMNPYKANGGSVIFPPGVAATPMSNDRIYYKSISGTLKVVNLTSLATHVQIYWLMVKKDSFYEPENIWAHSMTDEAMGSVTAIPSALTATGVATPGAPLNSNIGQNPFMYQGFRDHYRVLVKKTYYLQGGDEVDTNYRFEYNKLLKKSTYEETPADCTFLANHTIIPFVIFKGALVGINDVVLPAPAAEVTPGAAKLGFYINQTHEFGPVPAELKTPTTQYFPGAIQAGTQLQRQIDDTDEADPVKIV